MVELEVRWFAWLEWTADEQLSRAVKGGSDMQVGLYRDLAVGGRRGRYVGALCL